MTHSSANHLLSAAPSTPTPLRVLHFVTGGFSGATQVAVDLCLAAQASAEMEVLLVLRRKRNTSEHRVQHLRAQGLQVQVVSNWLHMLTVWELRRIIRAWRPDVVVAHGFSDHIWGRQAAVAEGVARIFHVEHNSRERYTPRRLRQALALAPATQASIGVSEGVRRRLVELGFPAADCVAIPNGIDLDRFPEALLAQPWPAREAAVLMASRFARQKDQASLIAAIGILRDRGLRPPLYLAGAGSRRLEQQARQQVQRLGLQEQVQFLGNVADLPQRLGRTRIFVLSTHWEGMPLALVEAMAAGCACIVSDVVGAREVIQPERTGLLVPEGQPEALAQALQRLLEQPALAQRLGEAARAQAMAEYGRGTMWQGYRRLLLGV